MPLALDQRVGTVVWSPLGWGRLTGRLRRGDPLPEASRLQNPLVVKMAPPVAADDLYRVVDVLEDVARDAGKSVPQVAINWLSQRPSVATIIVGARNAEQLRHNIAAVGWSLNAAQMNKLDEASARTPIYPYWHQRGFAERNPPPV
jgi:aryl-alcohol dehydrogenase-like predicted oxidoreductase